MRFEVGLWLEPPWLAIVVFFVDESKGVWVGRKPDSDSRFVIFLVLLWSEVVFINGEESSSVVVG